nr:hypothetical protein Iba_chr02bCG1410 [Ipomoea batatas]
MMVIVDPLLFVTVFAFRSSRREFIMANLLQKQNFKLHQTSIRLQSEQKTEIGLCNC